MENFPTWMPVVAAALTDGGGRWLMHRRPSDKHHAGLWEFPGGKVEPGENPREALVREVNEELGLSLDPTQLAAVAFADGATAADGRPIVILLYTTHFPPGAVASLEGGETGWFTHAEIVALDMPPLDIRLAARLAAMCPDRPGQGDCQG